MIKTFRGNGVGVKVGVGSMLQFEAFGVGGQSFPKYGAPFGMRAHDLSGPDALYEMASATTELGWSRRTSSFELLSAILLSR